MYISSPESNSEFDYSVQPTHEFAKRMVAASPTVGAVIAVIYLCLWCIGVGMCIMSCRRGGWEWLWSPCRRKKIRKRSIALGKAKEQEWSLKPINDSPWTLPVGPRQNRDDAYGEIHGDGMDPHLVASSSARMTSHQTERDGPLPNPKAFKSTRFEENPSGEVDPSFFEPETSDTRRLSREVQPMPTVMEDASLERLRSFPSSGGFAHPSGGVQGDPVISHHPTRAVAF